MPVLLRNIELEPNPLPLTTWRKTAIATWPDAASASVLGAIEVELDPIHAYLKEVKERHPTSRLTLTHFFGKVMGYMLREHPEVNAVVKFGNLYRRKNVDIFFQAVASEDGRDLSGITVRHVDRKSITEVAEEMNRRAKELKQKKDPAFDKMKQTIKLVPSFLLYYVLKFVDFLLFYLNVWSPLLGSPRDAFGSMMLTNIGSLGLPMAFAPLIPYAHAVMIVAVGQATQKLVLLPDKTVGEIPVLNLFCTFDHRIMDGAHAAILVKTVKEVCRDPARYLGY